MSCYPEEDQEVDIEEHEDEVEILEVQRIRLVSFFDGLFSCL